MNIRTEEQKDVALKAIGLERRLILDDYESTVVRVAHDTLKEATEELWIVAIDTPHYPEIHEFDNETEATAAYHKALNKRQRPDCGDDYAYYVDESTVYMAKVERVGELEER